MAIADLCFIDETGYHYPDFPTVLEALYADYRAIHGADVYIDPDSQDGQDLAIRATALHDCMALGAAIYRSFSPSTALGDALSSNVKINGIRRNVATFSTVDLTIVGAPGATILAGQAEDVAGRKWLLPDPTVIDISGSMVVTATAAEIGAIEAIAGSITKIATPTLGWQTVTNLTPAVAGAPVESNGQLAQRQQVSTALPALTVFEATVGAVASVSGVTRYRGYENDEDTTSADGLPPHSISLIVEGGDSAEIAAAIARRKTPGTPTYGTTSVVVFDSRGVPNTIRFYRPTPVEIRGTVTIQAKAGYTTGYAALIKDAVAAAINALPIGDDVIYTDLYVSAKLPGTPASQTFYVTEVKIAIGAATQNEANIAIAFNEAADCTAANITVNVLP